MQRLRRLRRSAAMRDLVAETQVRTGALIYPIFVIDGENIREEVPSMPGVYRYSVDRLEEIVDEMLACKIGGTMLFGVPAHKDDLGSEAYAEDGVVQRAIRRIKQLCAQKREALLVIADICLCEYASHGHCGVLRGGDVDNDASLPLHAKAALAAVRAGADIVAPSSMMDGVVAAIREALDESGFAATPIMGYSAKFASVFYSPFRDAADSAPQTGDRRGYQMDFRNGREALRELAADEAEGADILMVKPALAYLDVIHAARAQTKLALAVYNVSGGYAMVKAAARAGMLDEKRVVTELLTAFFRAGADVVITYHALDWAHWQQEHSEK